MKLVQIITRMNVGGAATHVSILASGLREHGFETLVVRGLEGAGEGHMDHFARDRGVSPVRLPSLRREVRPWADARALVDLTALLRRERPLIVHTHTSKAGVLGRMAAFRARVPVVVHTFHGHVLDGYFHPAVARGILALERALARRSHGLIAVSRSTAADLARAGVAPAEKIRHIPLGLPIEPLLSLTRGRGDFRRSLRIPRYSHRQCDNDAFMRSPSDQRSHSVLGVANAECARTDGWATKVELHRTC